MKNNLIKLLMVSVTFLSTLAHAEYPEKPVKLVVAFPGGTVPDIMARSYGEKLKTIWSQPLVIDSRPGATGTVGADLVARAPGDGYTLLLNSSGLMISPWLVKIRFDVFNDLVPVIRTAYTPYLFLVSGKLPVKDFNEFLAYAKKNPGKLTCATYGIGSPPHMALEMLNREAGVKIVHVPYATTNSMPDTVSGNVDCTIAPPLGQDQYVKTGAVRVLAHSGDKTWPMFPDAVPVGKNYPAAAVLGWQAIFAPASTPKPLLDKLRADWARTLSDPVIVQKVREIGFEPMGDSSIEQATRSMREEHEKFGEVIRTLGIKAQ